MKYILALVIGLGVGYYTGYKDGSEGNPSVGERVTSRIGGKSRGRVGNDIDAKMKAVEDGPKTEKRP